MVEVQVREEEVDRAVVAVLERHAERTDARARVEDEHRPVGEEHLDARGVAAVAHGPRPRRGERSPAAPDRDAHVSPAAHRSRAARRG